MTRRHSNIILYGIIGGLILAALVVFFGTRGFDVTFQSVQQSVRDLRADLAALPPEAAAELPLPLEQVDDFLDQLNSTFSRPRQFQEAFLEFEEELDSLVATTRDNPAAIALAAQARETRDLMEAFRAERVSFGGIATFGAYLGEFFLRSLRMIIVPLVLITVIAGVTRLGDIRMVGGLGLRTLGYYALTTALSVGLGLIMVNLIRPGAGVPPPSVQAPEKLAAVQEQSLADIFLSFVHPNIFRAFSEPSMLPIIVFSLVFGAVLTTLGKKGEPVIAVLDGLNEAIMKVVQLVMWIAPIGIFGLVTAKFGTAALTRGVLDLAQGIAWYMGTVIGSLAIHGFVTLFVLCWLLGRRNPLSYFVAMVPALLTAWSTASSSATLPLTMECAEDRAGVQKRSTGFVMPLGATINMDGTALYEAVAAVFIAQAYGIPLGPMQMLLIFITATLVSIGAAGIPEAGLFMMVIVLTAVNLPIDGVAIILVVDWFLDRFRTAVNVWGDSVGTAFIDRHIGPETPAALQASS